jgi:hypothetical protein
LLFISSRRFQPRDKSARMTCASIHCQSEKGRIFHDDLPSLFLSEIEQQEISQDLLYGSE